MRLATRMGRAKSVSGGLAVLLLAGLSVPGARAQAPLAAELPRPTLEEVDPEVRRQLTEMRAEVDRRGALQPVPEDLGRRLGQMGTYYLAYDFLQPAAACFQAAHEQQPLEFSWLYLLGYTQDRIGDLAGAMESLAKSLRLAPKDPAALVRLGDLYLANQRMDEALPLYQRAYETSEDCVSALYGMGEIARREKDFERAERYLSQALAKRPGATQVRYPLGLVLRQLGRREEAKAMLSEVDFDQVSLGAWVGCADPLAEQVRSLTVGSAAHILRAAQAAFLGQEDVEEEEYRKAVAANPDDPVAHRGLGSLLLRKGDLDGARSHFETALSLNPTDGTLQRAFGQILLLQGEVPRAVAHLKRAVELAPKLKEAHLILAEVYLQNSRFEEVLHHTEQALAVDPVNPQARVWKAIALLQSGRQREAIEGITQFMDDSPPEDPAERLRLSTLLISLGEAERAVGHFQAILGQEADPQVKALAHTRIGQVRLRQGQTEEAVSSLRAALAISPGLDEAKSALSEALAGQGG